MVSIDGLVQKRLNSIANVHCYVFLALSHRNHHVTNLNNQTTECARCAVTYMLNYNIILIYMPY